MPASPSLGQHPHDPPPAPPPAPPRLQVRGGVGGVTAELEALRAGAAALLRLGAALDAVPDGLAVGRAAGALLRCVALDPAGSAELQRALAHALGPTGAPAVALGVAGLGRCLSDVVTAYSGVDAAVALGWGSLRWAVAVAGADLGVPGCWWPQARREIFSAAAGQHADTGAAATARTGVPAAGQARLPLPRSGAEALVDLVAAAAGGPDAHPGDLAASAIPWALGQGMIGGTAVVVAAAPGARGAPRAGVPARGAADLLSRVHELSADPRQPTRAGAAPGTVRVERITRPGRRPVAVVYVPGTQTGSPAGGADPFDGASDVRAAAGQTSAASSAVTSALDLAGVGRDEPLMLVGHSLGGMTVTHLAGDPAFRARFTPVAVLTAGSPVAAEQVPGDVAVLSLEHADDLVVVADGAANPDTPSRTTVTAPTPAGRGPHDLVGYAATGELVDASDDPSITAWREVAAPFLAAEGSASASTDWVAHRSG